MRALTQEEEAGLNGGRAPAIAVAVGAVGRALAGYGAGGIKAALAGAVLGASAAVASTMAAITTGFTRLG